jgi:signal recognition particle subunit SRP72
MSNLAALLKKTHIEDDEEVLKAANNALKQNKSDLQAQHVKVVALLKLDRYDDALKALDDGGEKLKERASLEHSYALYKSGKPSAAAELAQKGSKRGFHHVEAQARYRIEDFPRAAELYKQLASRTSEDAPADLLINSGAVDAQLEWTGRGDLVQKKKPGREDMEAFETAYNAACGSIARGELGQGEVLLKRAKELCSAVEDMSDEEKETELLPIVVQQIYVLSRLGRSEEAEALAKGLDVSKVSDASTRHIAKVNEVAATTSDDNPYLTQRLIAKDLDALKTDYPFRFQSAILKSNSYASALQTLKFGGTASSTQDVLAKQTAPTTDAFYTSLSVVNAAAHAKCQIGKEALKHILPVLERRPNDVGLALTIAQLYTLTGNSGAAVALLGNFIARLEQTAPEVRFAPGLVGAVVSLYDSQGQKGPMRTELAKAARYWKENSKERPTGFAHLFKAAGRALLESEEQEHLDLARSIFEELNSRDPNDRYAAAGLLAATPEKATREQLSALQPIDRLISGINVDALENAGIAQPPSTGQPTTRKRPAEDTKPTKAKKIRKNRIPKDYDPSKTPDPERWLPLKDRSTYRPKGKKGKARQALLSQGAAVTNECDGSRPATPGAEVLKGKAQGGGGGGANKKKKGKGGKW